MRRLLLVSALGSAGLCLACSAGAAGPGTTGANFLKFAVGPRQVAMGDQGAALPDDAFSLAHNPANLALLNYQEVSFMHNQWTEGISQDYAAYVYPRHSLGSVGASLNLFQVGAFPGYDNSGGRTGDVNAQDFAATFGYARNVLGHAEPEDGPGLSAGVSATTVRERLENESASTVAGDAGLLYHCAADDIALRFGLAARNLGPGLSYYGARASLPRSYAAAASASTRRFWGDLVTVSLEARKPVDRSVAFSLGGEYWINSMLALRGGYVTNEDLGPGVRAGLGLKVKVIEFDYAMSLLGDFGLTHRVGATFRFGAPVFRTPTPSPESKAAAKAVRQAKALLDENRPLDALLEINKALELDPNLPEALGVLDQVQIKLKEIESNKTP